MTEMRERLIDRFRERRYREQYLEGFLNTRIAAQIKMLREARKLSQAGLAKRIGTTQPGISALENVDYTSWSLRTLKKLAKAFDVALIVKFESFSKALDDITGFSAESLAVPSFAKDPIFHSKSSANPEVGGEALAVSLHDAELVRRQDDVFHTAAKLTEKHQITLPAELRNRLGLAAGDLIVFALEGDRAVLRAEHGGWTEASRGLGAELWRTEGGGETGVERERNACE
jgi:AbrB family looped-hinge helix DNA binding protein